MERKNNFAHRLTHIEAALLSPVWVLRFLVLLTLCLAVVAGLGWEKYTQLEKKYDFLQKRHERLNKIYLQEKVR